VNGKLWVVEAVNSKILSNKEMVWKIVSQ